MGNKVTLPIELNTNNTAYMLCSQAQADSDSCPAALEVRLGDGAQPVPLGGRRRDRSTWSSRPRPRCPACCSTSAAGST